jgi:hypothetical protein
VADKNENSAPDAQPLLSTSASKCTLLFKSVSYNSAAASRHYVLLDKLALSFHLYITIILASRHESKISSASQSILIEA